MTGPSRHPFRMRLLPSKRTREAAQPRQRPACGRARPLPGAARPKTPETRPPRTGPCRPARVRSGLITAQLGVQLTLKRALDTNLHASCPAKCSVAVESWRYCPRSGPLVAMPHAQRVSNRQLTQSEDNNRGNTAAAAELREGSEAAAASRAWPGNSYLHARLPVRRLCRLAAACARCSWVSCRLRPGRRTCVKTFWPKGSRRWSRALSSGPFLRGAE